MPSGGIGENLMTVFDSVWRVRNLVIHGRDVSDDEVKQALMSGAAILASLESATVRSS